MHESEREHELAAWEARLGAFRPPASRLDRDRVMFLAGRASVQGERLHGAAPSVGWVWPAALASMTAVAGGLLVALVMRHPGDTSPPGPDAFRAVAQETPGASVQHRDEAPGSGDDRDVPAVDPQLVFWPDTDMPETPTVRSPRTNDADRTLVQLADGRFREPGWERACPPGSFGPPVGPDDPRRPRSYVEHRRMLLEELECLRETSAERSFRHQPTGV